MSRIIINNKNIAIFLRYSQRELIAKILGIGKRYESLESFLGSKSFILANCSEVVLLSGVKQLWVRFDRNNVL